MRRFAGMAVLSAACAVAPGFAGQAPKAPMPPIEQVLTMRVDGTIAVDATGKVLGYEVKTEIEPKIRALIDKAVTEWLFFPPMVDGRPGAAKSDMRITLLGKPIEGGYEVSIDNVLFSRSDVHDWNATRDRKDSKGPKEAVRESSDEPSMSIVAMRPMPMYPKFNVNGIVTILLNIAPDGRVLDAVPTQCSLYQAGGSEMQLKRACKAMEDNAANAIRKWRIAIDTHGKPLKTPTLSGTIPVQYVMPGRGADLVSKASKPGNWRLESRTPYRLPEWAREDRFAQRMGTSDSVGGELMSTESPLRLREGVTGKVL